MLLELWAESVCIYLCIISWLQPFDITSACGFEVSLASLASFAVHLSGWCIYAFGLKRRCCWIWHYVKLNWGFRRKECLNFEVISLEVIKVETEQVPPLQFVFDKGWGKASEYWDKFFSWYECSYWPGVNIFL